MMYVIFINSICQSFKRACAPQQTCSSALSLICKFSNDIAQFCVPHGNYLDERDPRLSREE